MIRVKLTMPYWPIERQTPSHSGIWDNCHFIINQQVPECDYWVVCESLINPEETLCPKENTILITHEPPTLGKYRTLFLKQFATVITCHKNIKHKNPIFQQQGLPWHVGRRQRNHVNLSWSKDYDELISVDRFHKDKNISVITSSKDGTVGQRQRLEFIRILKDYFGERIDIFGRGINEIEDKWDALNRYKYHIALENSAVENYWTEKLSDAYLAGCYPIYYGCPNIEKYFDTSSLAKIDIIRPDQAIHIIESCLKEHRYENAQQQIENARKNILNKYNVFPMVCNLINKNRRNLDNVKYSKIKMLPRYAKPLSFLIRDFNGRANMNKVFEKTFRKMYTLTLPTRILTSLSDNRAYPNICLKASNSSRHFNSFRRNKVYNEILEHVPEQQGGEYLDIIKNDADIFSKMDAFKENDKYGNPRTFYYPSVGKISPTTLRYIKVLADLKALFGTIDNLNIVEIGAGYGGQCRIINSCFKPNSYCLIDIKHALMLAKRFLDHYIIHSHLIYKSMNELQEKEYDLLISNYAFTELPRPIQDIYLKKCILCSKMGYITYNEITPPEFKSYKKEELINIIPNSEIRDEIPLTHSNNCIIVWGVNS